VSKQYSFKRFAICELLHSVVS